MRFQVPDMSCGHCRAAIERAVRGVDAEASLVFDMPGRMVEIDSKADGAHLRAAMTDAGYPPQAA